MKGNSRFLKSIIAAAREFDGSMPWTRGAARKASAARRRGAQSALRSA